MDGQARLIHLYNKVVKGLAEDLGAHDIAVRNGFSLQSVRTVIKTLRDRGMLAQMYQPRRK